MKLTSLCLFTAAYAAASTLANDFEPAAASPPSLSEEAIPSPTILSAEEYAILDARQAPHDPNAGGLPVAVTQPPTITTDWRPTMLPNGEITYWEDIFTQTFASIPNQLPSPGSGSIGYGTLKRKNDKRAEQTPAVTVTAQPVVMIMQTTIVVQPVQRVTEVQIVQIETETVVEEYPSPTPERNATVLSPTFFYPSGTGTGTGIFLGTGTAGGTALSGMPAPTNGSTPWTFKRRS